MSNTINNLRVAMSYDKEPITDAITNKKIIDLLLKLGITLDEYEGANDEYGEYLVTFPKELMKLSFIGGSFHLCIPHDGAFITMLHASDLESGLELYSISTLERRIKHGK